MSSETAEKHVFIVGYESFNAKLLEGLPLREKLSFHSLIDFDEIHGTEQIAALDLLHLAIDRIEKSEIKPDAIITYWDFPCTLIASILNARYGLNGPQPRSVFKCEHKGWSRSEQKKVIADHIPLFSTFDPNDEAAWEKINLLPPFWIKPVKSFQSWLSFKVTSRTDFEHFRREMAANVGGIYEPFVDLMRHCRTSELVTESSASCIAESSLYGHMCTVEGYVYDGQVTVYGLVDSIRELDSNSFQNYQYPSQLPMDIQFRMSDIARKAIDQIDLNDSCFNIEFFYNQTDDSIHLLEINPRTSQSHSDLFAKVHGYSQFKNLLEIALNRRPGPMKKEGEFPMACKYFHRVRRDGVVRQLPSGEDVAAIAARFPGTKIELLVEEGQRLSDLTFQDAYSYALAQVYLGGDNAEQIEANYREIIDAMGIIIDYEKVDDQTTADAASRITELVSP